MPRFQDLLRIPAKTSSSKSRASEPRMQYLDTGLALDNQSEDEDPGLPVFDYPGIVRWLIGWPASKIEETGHFDMDSKPIVHRAWNLSEATAREMRAAIRISRVNAITMTTQALEALDDPAACTLRNRLLDIFFGDHSDSAVAQLRTRIRTSKLVLESLRPSKDIRYEQQFEDSIMSTVALGGRPSCFTTGEGDDLTLHRRPVGLFGAAYLMKAYQHGMGAVNADSAAHFADGSGATLIHESVHATDECRFEVYQAMNREGRTVLGLVLLAAHEIRSKGSRRVSADLLRQTLFVYMATLESEAHGFKGAPKKQGDTLLKRFEAIWANPVRRRALLSDMLTQHSPYMVENAESFMCVVEGLSMLSRDPGALDRFFADYNRYLSDPFGNLFWQHFQNEDGEGMRA